MKLKYQIKTLLILFVSIALMSVGCGRGHNSSSDSVLSEPRPDSHASEHASKEGSEPSTITAWVKHDSASKDGTVRVSQAQMTESQIAWTSQTYKRVNLVQLPLDAKYNVNAFRNTDQTILDYLNKIFIAPKLFSYGTQQGGKLAPVMNADGTVTLSFNIAFVDGSTRTIQSPMADAQEVRLPDAFVVQHAEELKEVLRDQYGSTNGLAPLSGCPKEITLMAGGDEYDVTPSDLKAADFCQMNVPITVSLRLPRERAQMILENELYSGTVDVRGVYESRVSFPVANVKISFDRSKIFEDLQAELGAHIGWVDAQVKVAVTKVMQKQLMKVSIQGDTNELLDSLINRVTTEFFEPLRKDPNTPLQEGCDDAVVCLRLSATSAQQASALDFEWIQDTNSVTGQNYVTTTKLKPTPSKVTLGKERSCAKDCERVKNDGVPRETGLTVVNGNQIIIEPDYLIKESREGPFSDTARTDHPVCVHSHQLCVNGCDDLICKLLNRFPTKVCKNVCDENQDQWEEVTQYFVGTPRKVLLDQPIGLLNQLFDGLYLSFQWIEANGEKKSIECPTGVFPRIGNGRTLSVRLENQVSCKPFG